MSRYVNPFTDFGFKKLFGEEPNKDILIDFLNELLRGKEATIVDLTYLKNENLGSAENDRKAIFDLYCESETGEKFIVELQKTKQQFFKDRALYYATFPIREQAKINDWNYGLKAVYLIAILDFVFEEGKKDINKLRYDVQLVDVDTCKVFYNKLTFIYLEMPKFTKEPDQLSNRFEKWLYVIRNLDRLENIPTSLQERVFERLFAVAEIASFDRSQRKTYQKSLKYYRDLKNSIDTAWIESRQETTQQAVLKAHQLGLDIPIIAKIQSISEEEVHQIIQSQDS
ncbi:Rpn family recombination-promoting nuclease/putative transposase [Neolewinella sp.]|uniref:Rpn family recombination-promoting nuclease/putative transposase n=1 Tax=Neolewinella sp. TaxID=2993543 RepID=UPI003B52D9AD